MKHFRIRYKIGSVEAAWDTRCSSPITALNQFHNHAQVDLALKPHEYELCALAEVYNSDPTGCHKGIQIESPFDIPQCPNPNVILKVVDKESPPAFPFLKDTPTKWATPSNSNTLSETRLY